jgi:hypothetical protein
MNKWELPAPPLDEDDIPCIGLEDLERWGLMPWCRRHLNRIIDNGEFPPPVHLSKRKPRWTPRQIKDPLGTLLDPPKR